MLFTLCGHGRMNGASKHREGLLVTPRTKPRSLSFSKKHIVNGIRCSLENFGTFPCLDGKRIDIIPLYAISNLF